MPIVVVYHVGNRTGSVGNELKDVWHRTRNERRRLSHSFECHISPSLEDRWKTGRGISSNTHLQTRGVTIHDYHNRHSLHQCRRRRPYGSAAVENNGVLFDLLWTLGAQVQRLFICRCRRKGQSWMPPDDKW